MLSKMWRTSAGCHHKSMVWENGKFLWVYPFNVDECSAQVQRFFVLFIFSRFLIFNNLAILFFYWKMMTDTDNDDEIFHMKNKQRISIFHDDNKCRSEICWKLKFSLESISICIGNFRRKKFVLKIFWTNWLADDISYLFTIPTEAEWVFLNFPFFPTSNISNREQAKISCSLSFCINFYVTSFLFHEKCQKRWEQEHKNVVSECFSMFLKASRLLSAKGMKIMRAHFTPLLFCANFNGDIPCFNV